MTIIEAMRDPRLFGPWFRDEATGDIAASWHAWTAMLCLLFGLPLSEAQRDIALACMGLTELPRGPFYECWLIVGRRGGKSIILALVAVFLACFYDWSKNLVPGERGTILVLAADRKQAQSIMRYATAMVEQVPMLRGRIERVTTEEIELKGRIAIEVGTASYRTTRGRTMVACLLDELAFFRSEDSSNPDHEILAAVRPSMASVPEARLLCASSPHAKRGVLHDQHFRWFGNPDAPALIWQAPTLRMNPRIPQSVVDEAYERDPLVAAAEFGAEFRADIDQFVSREVISACTIKGRYELPYVPGQHYQAFCDPSGGSVDSFTLAISHREGDRAILDLVREVRPPFSPEAVTADFARVCKAYQVRTVLGDRYAGQWVVEAFRLNGIGYQTSGPSKSDLYVDCLPWLNSGKVELLDHARLATQFVGLERRTSRVGKDTIDHQPGGHDDICNAVAGAVVLSREKNVYPQQSLNSFFRGEQPGEEMLRRDYHIWTPLEPWN